MYDDIRTVVEEQLGDLRPERGIGLDDDLWDLGMTSVNSVGVMLAVEDVLGIEFPEEALSRETFSSVRRIGEVVSGLTPPGAGGAA